MKIAHVDDNYDDLELTRIRLTRRMEDLEIVSFSEADAALAELSDAPVDCIVSDYQMPIKNGLDLLRELRAANNKTPFIFLTGQGNEAVAREALRLGAHDYFTKDEGILHYERLVNSISRAVQERRSEVQKEKALSELRVREEGYRILLQQTSKGIFRINLEKPVPIDLPVEEQIELFYKYSYIAEANDAIAVMYGLEKESEIIGKRLYELHGGSENETNRETHRSFIENGYRIVNAITREVDQSGNKVTFRNNVIGIISEGHLICVWGTQTEESNASGLMNSHGKDMQL